MIYQLKVRWVKKCQISLVNLILNLKNEIYNFQMYLGI